MRHFFVVVGSIAGNFIVWTAITFLPVHPAIIIALAIASGVLMIYCIVHFTVIVDKHQ